MPKVLLDYSISGSIEVEINKERLERLNKIMENKKEFEKLNYVLDEFCSEIQDDIEDGNSREEVLEFGIEE